MTIRVGPTEKQPTHHIKIVDRAGVAVGLILCDQRGEPSPTWSKIPIDRTSIVTSAGAGQYSDFEHPYSLISQDDWSGGRGNLDFERDATKFYDSYRVNTHRENKVFFGPQEFYSKGYKTMQYSMSGLRFSRFTPGTYSDPTYSPAYTSFVASSSYTMARLWLLIRKVGTPANNLVITLRDTTGVTVHATATITVASVTDVISFWKSVSLSFSLVSGTTYRIYFNQTNWTDSNRWEWMGYEATKGGTNYPTYLIETAAVDDSVIYYEYKQQQYKVLSTVGSAPTIWMNGDRGAADSNAGDLTKVKDATKSWTTNQWAGCVVKILKGPGYAEPTQYRTIVSNTATELVCDSAWTITHTTSTEYVIVASEDWRQITGHGLTVPITNVLVVGEVVYFAQGDSVLMRSHREYNNGGTWTESEWNAETLYATHLAYQPISNRIWLSHNDTPSVTPATPTTYGTDLVAGDTINVGFAYDLINSLETYPNDNGYEALWVYKEELAYVVVDSAEGIKLSEMKAVRSRRIGYATLVHNVYSFFTLGNGLERYYGGNIDDLGPNIGEGLPSDRIGPIIALQGFPGRFFAIVDGGASGYSSLLERAGSGWHEVYRAPLGERLKGMALQVIPGSTMDRMWLYQGNVSIWLSFSSDGANELTDSAYRYTHEGALILSRMHNGMYDLQKLIRKIKVWSQGLTYSENDSAARVQIKVDYRIDDATTWTPITVSTLITSPRSTLDLTSLYGIAGQRIQLRIRFLSDDNTLTPILMAVLVECVNRIQIKYMYNLTFRCMDDEPTLAPREMDDKSVTANSQSAQTKKAILEAWSDADNDSMLYMTANSPDFNGKWVFLNGISSLQIAQDPDSTKPFTGYLFVCSATAQDA
jgi:hypothetical protein